MSRRVRFGGRRWSPLAAGLLAAVAISTGCGEQEPGPAAAPEPPPQVADLITAPPVVVETPVRLEIPSIGIDAPIEPLELTADGALEVPKDADITGWFVGGPEPGEPGNAVIVGHLDSHTGPGVFHRLRDLQRGDSIMIHGDNGAVVTFAVEALGQYDKDNFPTADVYGPSALPALRLITCGGGFDHATGHYNDNLVVYAWPSV